MPFDAFLAEVSSRLRSAEAWQEVYTWQGLGEGSLPAAFEFVALPGPVEAAGLQLRCAHLAALTERFEIRLTAFAADPDLGGEITLEIAVDRELFPPGTAELVLERYREALASVLAHPAAPLGRQRVVGAGERHQLLRAFNPAPLPPGPAVPFHRLFLRAAAASPDRIALVFEEERWSCACLAARARALARRLGREAGVGPGTPVPLLLERSPEMVVSLLAALVAGGAYVPLDPALPRVRLLGMLEDLRAPVLVTTATLAAQLGDDFGPGVRVVRVGEGEDGERGEEPGVGEEEEGAGDGAGDGREIEGLAYILFTSGSTGRPKGVMVGHREAAHYLRAVSRALDFEPGMSFALVSTFAADLGNTMLLPALGLGGCLHVIAQERLADAEAMAEIMSRHRIDCLKIVPSHLAALLSSPRGREVLPGRRLVLGGEATRRDLLEQILALSPRCLIYNHYGPTEATVGVATFPFRPGETEVGPAGLPLGRPLSGLCIHVLDRELQLAPRGVPGELALGGAGITRGYLGRPAQTAEKFVPDPFAEALPDPRGGARLYRSGDLGRHLPGGELEFLGRIDDQVKIRGFRVEPREIEAALREHPGIEQAVVMVREREGAPGLVAYLVPDARQAAPVRARLRGDGEELPPGTRQGTLPDGTPIVEISRRETRYLYQEIFEQQVYLRGGIRLAEDACVLDVGANIGLFSLFVHRIAPRATVHAFEPLPAPFSALERNLALHGIRGAAHPFGISSTRTTATFTYYPHLTLLSTRYGDIAQERGAARAFLEAESGGALAESQIDEILDERLGSETRECSLRPLSEVIRELGLRKIDLLKIDAQKSELDVLSGIDPEHWPRIGQVVVEVHAVGDRRETIPRLLEERGFAVEVEAEDLRGDSDRFLLHARRPDRDGREAAVPAPARAAVPVQRWADAEALGEDLRAFLRERLAELMVPSAFLFLDHLPLTPNGKLDRSALPAPEEALAGRRSGSRPAATPSEEIIANLWGQLLGRAEVGAEDNFFEIGGHSLLATQVISRIREVFHVELVLRHLFDAPTVAGLARQVEEARNRGRAAELPPIPSLPRDQPLPLSFAQQRLWFLDQLHPGVPAYHLPLAVRLAGALDVEALNLSLATVLARHEILRTTFEQVEGQPPAQRIHPPGPLPLPVVDLRGLGPAAGEAEGHRLLHREARRPFLLTRGPLLRATLLRLTSEHWGLLTMHHIASDGWSQPILLRELCQLYAGRVTGLPVELPELPIQYADFAAWQRQWLRGEALERELTYWRGIFGDSPPILELPTDHPRPRSRSWRGGAAAVQVPAATLGALSRLGQAEGATLFMTFLAAYALLLYRVCGQEEITVGTGVASRNRPELENLIGFFVNTLALRIDLAGNPTFRTLLSRVRETTLDAYDHGELPFDKLIESLAPRERGAHSDLFRVMFTLREKGRASFSLPGLELAELEARNDTAKFDQILSLSVAEEGLSGTLEYDLDLFEPESIRSFLASFVALLAEVGADPDRPLLDLPIVPDSAAEQPMAAAPNHGASAEVEHFNFELAGDGS